ncbi:MAG: cell division protein FtsZ [Pseudomonadota bacterium]
MAINLQGGGKPESLRPTITVIGVGGAGGNAVNNMINANLEGVNFVVANTDAQALENSLTERRIQLGSSITRGLGAGANPDVGCMAAEEAMEEISSYIDGSNMVFITAGMGGGTGTGAAPVIARLAKERGILTVGVVTKPFQFEGNHRMRLAEQGLRELQQFVDTLIVIPNQNLFRIANEKTTFADAFRLADEVLHSGVRGVTDLMIMPGLINLDFADIRTVMGEMGKAMMGTGEAEGAKRAVEAAEAAISNPLLDDVSMKGARGVLINITGGYDMTLFEADEAATRIREEVDPEANIIFGATFNAALEGKMRVSVVATGIDMGAANEQRPQANENNRVYGGKLGFNSLRQSAPFKSPLANAQITRNNEIKANSQPVQSANSGLRASFAPKKPAVPQQPTFNSAPPAQQFSAHVSKDSLLAAKKSLVAFARTRNTFIGAIEREEEPQKQLTLPITQQRDVGFVSPAPAQPLQRSLFNTQDKNDFVDAPKALTPQMSQKSRNLAGNPANTAKKEQEAPSNAMSFFQKMAGVGKALATKSENSERNVQVVDRTKVGVVEMASGGSNKKQDESDYLEIPEFLRRQAN